MASARRGGGGDLVFALLHPGIAFDQQRLDFGELPLPGQRMTP